MGQSERRGRGRTHYALRTTHLPTSLLTASASATQEKGKACTKLVVPSTGSQIQVGAAVSGGIVPAAEASSCLVVVVGGNMVGRACSLPDEANGRTYSGQ